MVAAAVLGIPAALIAGAWLFGEEHNTITSTIRRKQTMFTGLVIATGIAVCVAVAVLVG